MKKTAAIALMLIYLAASSGAVGSMHYCGGVLASVSFVNDSANKCACESEAMGKDCCQDKNFYLHLDDWQQNTSQVNFDFHKALDIDAALVPVSRNLFYQPSWVLINSYISYHPPDNVSQPLYVLNQVFRI